MTLAQDVQKNSLEELLLESGTISLQDMNTALETQQKEGRKLTDVLVAMGLMTSEDVATLSAFF